MTLPKELKNETKSAVEVTQTPMLQDNQQAFTGQGRIPRVGGPVFDDSEIGSNQLVVRSGAEIQSAIDRLNDIGGGVVFLKNANYLIDTDIILYPNIYLEGENAARTILDFKDNTHGMIILGTDVYNDGTVSINNNSTTVTGAGTTFTVDMVGRYILIGGVWYPIVAFGSTTSLTIALPFATSDISGVSYTISNRIDDVKLTNFSIQNASTGIKAQYSNELVISDVDIQTCVTAMDFDNSSNIEMGGNDIRANNNGMNFNDCHFVECSSTGVVDTLAGNGLTATNMTNSIFISTFVLNSAADGVNLTDCSNININGVFLENTGDGIEYVSGNSDIVLSGSAFENNGGDGVKLTATTDNCFFYGNSIKDNGGFGINIVDSTSDNSIISTCNFSGNSSGAVDDNGTGTVIRGNVGVDDNSTSGNVLGVVASDTLVASADTERSTASTVLVIKKEIVVRIGGTIRVKFDMKEPSGTQTATGQIYVNGVAVGISQTTMSATYVTFSEDISIKPFDLVQLYLKTSLAGNPAFTENFRIYYDTTSLDQTTVNTD